SMRQFAGEVGAGAQHPGRVGELPCRGGRVHSAGPGDRINRRDTAVRRARAWKDVVMSTAAHGEKARQARSFGAAAEEYERGRPSYPAEAIAWLVPEDARVVVDVGAGTGKMTRALGAPGREVIAVEPSAGMREQFARVLPEVELLMGAAEAIPLPDATADVLVYAQAWHWVDPERAIPEAARVLRPG